MDVVEWYDVVFCKFVDVWIYKDNIAYTFFEYNHSVQVNVEYLIA